MKKEEILKKINEMARGFSFYEIFNDWIKMAAISISNSSDALLGTNFFEKQIFQKREDEFLSLARKHNRIDDFAELTGMLTLALEDNIEDVLGWVYMSGELGSSKAGQFFTPFNLSCLVVETRFADYDGGKLTLNEPSAGGGGMIIAAAKVLRDKGYNYQSKLKVIAQDLDWKGVYMTYVQLSLLGIEAKVVQGDTLSGERSREEQVYYTPFWKALRSLRI